MDDRPVIRMNDGDYTSQFIVIPSYYYRNFVKKNIQASAHFLNFFFLLVS